MASVPPQLESLDSEVEQISFPFVGDEGRACVRGSHFPPLSLLPRRGIDEVRDESVLDKKTP